MIFVKFDENLNGSNKAFIRWILLKDLGKYCNYTRNTIVKEKDTICTKIKK